MEINWFPGHMAKALRGVQDNLKKVDMVIETCDARIPNSSRNPELDKILGTKPRILVLNKADLAEDFYTRQWIRAYESRGIKAISLDGTNKAAMKKLKDACLALCAGKIERAMRGGRLIRPVRAMVVGIPNTGKSTIINTMAGRRAAEASDRPGVTRASQWVRADDQLELMDMPGVLWPKIDRREDQIRLTATGAIRDAILDIVEVAYETMALLTDYYPDRLKERYRIVSPEDSGDSPLPGGKIPFETFETAARGRGCLLSGGRADTTRFAALFLDDVRGGRLGKLTLERPSEEEKTKTRRNEHDIRDEDEQRAEKE